MASVEYLRFRGIRVSKPWHALLTAASADGVDFQLNSGHRSMAEQGDLVRRKGVWSPSNRTGAARPSRTAPHIRVGRPGHALDVDTARGGNVALAEWLRARGVPAVFNVPGEPWHLDPTSDARLRSAARKVRRAARTFRREWLTPSERSATRELLRLRREDRDIPRRSALKRWCRAQADALDALGAPKTNHRRDRARYLRDVAANRTR